MDVSHWKRRFYTIWVGQSFSLLGSALVQFALIWWLTATTGSAVTLATATIMSQIPTIVIGPIAGVLVDRWPRKWVLILSDGAIALLTALLGLLFWLGLAEIWHVYVILFLRSLADRFQDPAMIATTSAMVPGDQLTRVGGLRSTVRGITDIAAPLLGALMLALFGVQGVLPLDLATAVFAIGPLFFVPIPEVASKAKQKGLGGIVTGLKEGYSYLRARPGLMGLEVSSAMWALGAIPAYSLVPLLVTQHFMGGALELGWMQSAFGFGSIAGGMLLSLWGGYRRSMATCTLGTFGMAAAFLVIAFAPADALWLAIIGLAMCGLALPPTSAGFRATAQRVVEPGMLGRYFGLHSSLNRAIGPLGLAIAAPIAERVGVRPLWFAATVSALGIAAMRRFIPAIYRIEDGVTEGDEEEVERSTEGRQVSA